MTRTHSGGERLNCPVPPTGRGYRRQIVTLTCLVAAIAASGASEQASPLPNKSGSLKFAAIGDNGTGDQPQYDVARQMATAHAAFPNDLVIMLGDNMYGEDKLADFVNKFEKPYAPLLQAGVTFRASLGNHDRPDNVSHKLYNMDGQRYYTYTRNNVRFVVLDRTSWMGGRCSGWRRRSGTPRSHGRSVTSIIRSTRTLPAMARRLTCVSSSSRSSCDTASTSCFRGPSRGPASQAAERNLLFRVGLGWPVAKGQHAPR